MEGGRSSNSSAPSSTQKSQSISSNRDKSFTQKKSQIQEKSQIQSVAKPVEEGDERTKTATASKMKIFWKKVKKSLTKSDRLPSDLEYHYGMIAAYREALHGLFEAIRHVVLPDPEELTRARSNGCLGTFQAGQANGLYERLYAALGNNKQHLSHYENFEKTVRMAWGMAKEERSHQEKTEKLLADVTRFLEVEYPAIEENMSRVQEQKKYLEAKQIQLEAYAKKPGLEHNANYLADKATSEQASSSFRGLCEETKKLIKKRLNMRDNHETAILHWLEARHDFHEKIQHLMDKAGIPDTTKHK